MTEKPDAPDRVIVFGEGDDWQGGSEWIPVPDPEDRVTTEQIISAHEWAAEYVRVDLFDTEKHCCDRELTVRAQHKAEIARLTAALAAVKAERDEWERDANQRAEWHQELSEQYEKLLAERDVLAERLKEAEQIAARLAQQHHDEFGEKGADGANIGWVIASRIHALRTKDIG